MESYERDNLSVEPLLSDHDAEEEDLLSNVFSSSIVDFVYL